MNLTIFEGDDEDGQHQTMDFDSNQVDQNEFGEYVASLHTCNNSSFILQYQVIGENFKQGAG